MTSLKRFVRSLLKLEYCFSKNQGQFTYMKFGDNYLLCAQRHDLGSVLVFRRRYRIHLKRYRSLREAKPACPRIKQAGH